MKNAEQSGPGYDPQAAVMRWLPLATIAILTPGGSILTRDVHMAEGMSTGQSSPVFHIQSFFGSGI